MTLKKSRNLKLLLFCAFLIGAVGLLYIMRNAHFNSKNNRTEFTMSADRLITSYLTNEKKADSLYTNKQLEVSGILKEVNFINNRKTIILKTQRASTTIICDLNATALETVQKLKREQYITVIGTCKGFLKDVILLNCNIKLNE